MMSFHPKDDGLTHINIYSRANTDLGKALSNFSHLPIEHPKYGRFESIEGFWYWVSTGKQQDILRTFYGIMAKKEGLTYPKIHSDTFMDEIKEAIKLKIEQHPKLKQALIESTLPFTHYYYYGTIDNCKIVDQEKQQWLAEYFNELRNSYNQGELNDS